MRYALGREGEHGGMRDPRRESGRSTASRFVRSRASPRTWTSWAPGLQRATGATSRATRAYFNWRYLDSPRDYRCFGAYREDGLVGVAVVGHTFKHGVSAGFLADLVAAPDEAVAVRALARVPSTR